MLKQNNRYQIKSGDSFIDFDGINTKQVHGYLEIKFTDQSTLKCTREHLVYTRQKSFIRACQLHPGATLPTGIKVVSNTFIDGDTAVYDIVNSMSHCYNTNNVISHNCSFIGSSETLIESNKLEALVTVDPIEIKGHLFYFQMPQSGHDYCITVDTSRGRGRDYSAFSVIDITKMPYNIVCTYKDNEITVIEYPILIARIGKMYNNALIQIENNDLGESVANSLWFDLEYDNLVWTKNEDINGGGKNSIIGIRTTRKLKSNGCTALKNLIECDQLIINDQRIKDELRVFVRQSKGLYGASNPKINDDLISTLWQFGWLSSQNYFANLTDINTSQMLSKQYANKIDEYLPIGFKSDGFEDEWFDKHQLSNDQIELLTL